MNKKAKIAVCLSLAALMFISVFGMVGFTAADDQARAPITESENSENQPNQAPKSEPAEEPQVNVEEVEEEAVEEIQEKKPSLLDRLFGRDKTEQAPVDPAEQPSEDAVATVSDCYDGYCDEDRIVSRTVVNRNTRTANRVRRDGAYNRGNMDRAYRADNRASRGRVVDGSVNDRPGIIGDEGRRMHTNGGRDLERSFDRIGNGIEREVNRAERAVDRTFDRDSNVTRSVTRNTTTRSTNNTIWGIIIGLVIAAAVITLLAMLIPRRRHRTSGNNDNRHY